MATYIADALATSWLAFLLETPVYASLHIEQPSTDNPAASEVSGATYGRVPVTWLQVGSRTLVNDDPLQWLNLEQTSIGAVGLFSAAYGGAFLMSFTLDAPIAVPERGSYQIGAQDLTVTF